MAGWPSGRPKDGPLETGASTVAAVPLDKLAGLQPREERLATRIEVMGARADGKGLLVDLRGCGLFFGGGQVGFRAPGRHIPGAKNRPGDEFLVEPYYTFKSPEAIREILEEDKGSPVITYCNTGRVATVGYVAYRLAGFDDVAVYDGSMSEWGSHEECPVETGSGE